MTASSSRFLQQRIEENKTDDERKSDLPSLIFPDPLVIALQSMAQQISEIEDSDSSDEEEFAKYLKKQRQESTSETDSSDEENFELAKKQNIKSTKSFHKNVIEEKPINSSLPPNISIEMQPLAQESLPVHNKTEEKIELKIPQSDEPYPYAEKLNLGFSTISSGIQGSMIILSIIAMFADLMKQEKTFNPLYLLLAVPAGLALAGVTFQGISKHSSDLTDKIDKLIPESQRGYDQAVKILKLVDKQEKEFSLLKAHATKRRAALLGIKEKNLKQIKTPAAEAKLHASAMTSKIFSPPPSSKEAERCLPGRFAISLSCASVNFLSHVSTLYVAREVAKVYLQCSNRTLLPWDIAGVIAAFCFNLRILKDIEQGFERYSQLEKDIDHTFKLIQKLFTKIQKTQNNIFGNTLSDSAISKLEKEILDCKSTSDEVDEIMSMPKVDISLLPVNSVELDFLKSQTQGELIHSLRYCYYWISNVVDILSAVTGTASSHYGLYKLINQNLPGDSKEPSIALSVGLGLLGFLNCVSTLKNILRGSNFGIFRFKFQQFKKDIIELNIKTSELALKKVNPLYAKTLVKTKLLHEKIDEFIPIAKYLCAAYETKKEQAPLAIAVIEEIGPSKNTIT